MARITIPETGRTVYEYSVKNAWLVFENLVRSKLKWSEPDNTIASIGKNSLGQEERVVLSLTLDFDPGDQFSATYMIYKEVRDGVRRVSMRVLDEGTEIVEVGFSSVPDQVASKLSALKSNLFKKARSLAAA